MRKLVELHQGSVSAKSPGTGGGSTFTVRLPMVESSNVQAEVQPAESGAPGTLLASHPGSYDNQDAATSLAMLLKELGHDVDTAFGGYEGVSKAAAMCPRFMFLDLGMPRLNGLMSRCVCGHCRTEKEITLVALTGWGQTHDRERTRDAGFDGHLLKPIDPAVLEGCLPRLRHAVTAKGAARVAQERPSKSWQPRGCAGRRFRRCRSRSTSRAPWRSPPS